MQKQILMLSVAVAATFSASAMADTVPDPIFDITTALTQPITTATADPATGGPADIVLDTGGSLTVTSGTAAVTINSDNSFEQVTGTTISYKNAANAVGVLVDLTTNDINATNAPGCTPGTDCAHVSEGIIMDGTLDLSGTGLTKRGLWLEGPDSTGTTPGPWTFTGNIDLSQSTFIITGDTSVGVLIDEGANLNGNLTLGILTMRASSLTGSSSGLIGVENNGVINGDVRFGFVDTTNNIDDISTLNISGSTSTSATGVIAAELGTINGNVLIDTGSGITASGTGAEGIILTGDINPCSQAVTPGCSSLGSFINRGIIQTVGTQTPGTNFTGNPTSGMALGIGGSVAGGVLNDGPTSPSDPVAGATIGAQSAAPVIEISPALQGTLTPTSTIIGIYTPDHVDPGFSFLNRGSIIAASSNYNQDTTAFEIVGDGNALADLQGGLLNSGSIRATVNTTSAATTGATATAIDVGSNAYFGANDTYTYDSATDQMVYSGSLGLNAKSLDDRAALVNTIEAGGGTIVATASGPTNNNSAFAINIDVGATLPSIINGGTIEAAAISSDTSVTGLSAVAIQDSSGTLNYIQNNGTIEAVATVLDDKSQTAIAINLAGQVAGAAQNGVEILNQALPDHSATIIGDIDFGDGIHQIVNVIGVDTNDTATIIGDINFGAGGGNNIGSDELNIGSFGTVAGAITANSKDGVKVDVENNGVLTITNDTQALYAAGFHVESGGTLNLTVLSNFNTGIVDSSNFDTPIIFDTGAKLNIKYGSFVPTNSDFILFTAQGQIGSGNLIISQSLTDVYNAQLQSELPFLFKSASLSIQNNPDLLTESYILHVDVKDAQDLGLTGYAGQMLPLANQALVNDNPLGAAIVAGITNQTSAQNAYDQFAPDVSGAVRSIAMSLTDQATGPVAARQRMLRMYGKDSGDTTLWGQEFAEFIKDPGDTSNGKTGFKDHGFGFVMGIDGGEPKTGWYGGALSFYSGDVVEALPRDSHANTLWYTLTGYTDWRGKGLFLDTKVDVGYMTMSQKRFISLTIPPTVVGGQSTSFVDEADSRRPGLVGSAGFTTGVILAYGATTLTPQLSVDAMTLRQEGYSESHPTTSPGNGKGFDLTASSYYANSARVFVGADVRHDLDFGDFFVQPDVRAGYRYDFLNDPTKVTARFSNISPNATGVTPGPDFTIEGPDPSQGNFVAGASLSATTDAWTVGLNFDYVRGTNGAVTEVGTVHLLGRI